MLKVLWGLRQLQAMHLLAQEALLPLVPRLHLAKLKLRPKVQAPQLMPPSLRQVVLAEALEQVALPVCWQMAYLLILHWLLPQALLVF
jgi:hypothetical protein